LLPGLNLNLPEGQADFRLSRLFRSSLVETQFEYDFVQGDIAAALRYKYYGSRNTYTLSGFDSLRFRSLETVSQDFDRVRGANLLVRRPLAAHERLSLLAELDRLTFSGGSKDNHRTNVFLKLGFQTGAAEDQRSSQLAGDRTDRIRSLFSAYRTLATNGRGLSAAITWGVPAGSFSYVKAEAEAIQVLDLRGGSRLVGRLHAGFFPYRPYRPPEESSAGKPFRIPGGELFRLDGREALRGAKTGDRGVFQAHLTVEAFVPVFVDRDIPALLVRWNTLHGVLYAGTGTLGDEVAAWTSLASWRQDVGLGLEAAFSWRKYRVFLSLLVARVIQDSGSPRVLVTLRSAS
jgi:hypothetical protein